MATKCKIVVVPYGNPDPHSTEEIINTQLAAIDGEIGDKVGLDERRIAVFYEASEDSSSSDSSSDSTDETA